MKRSQALDENQFSSKNLRITSQNEYCAETRGWNVSLQDEVLESQLEAKKVLQMEKSFNKYNDYTPEFTADNSKSGRTISSESTDSGLSFSSSLDYSKP